MKATTVKVLFCAMILFAIAGCCGPSKSGVVAASRPTLDVSAGDLPRGVTAFDLRFYDEIGSYLVNEGPIHRGSKFSTLLFALDSARREEKRSIDEYLILSLLGPPDYWYCEDGFTQFVYLYDRFGNKDWVAVVDFDAQHVLAGVGWNGTTAIDVKKLAKFPNSPYLEKTTTKPAK